MLQVEVRTKTGEHLRFETPMPLQDVETTVAIDGAVIISAQESNNRPRWDDDIGEMNDD